MKTFTTLITALALVNSVVAQAAAAAALKSGLPNGVAAEVKLAPAGMCLGLVGQAGITAADGTQLKTGGVSCSSNTRGLVMGAKNMVSTMITSPADGGTLDASVSNTITLDNANLIAGFFSDANLQYYLAPQTQVGASTQGHQHVTVQQMNGNAPMDAKVFAFFKGINDPFLDPNKPQLQAIMPAGTLKANGVFRICTLTGADTHQPIISPVLSRGSQDDCVRVNVINAVAAAAA